MAKPYQDGKLWAIRRRFQGHEVFISGCATGAAAKKQMDLRVAQLNSAGKPKGLGPEHTTVAQALQDYGMERLKFMKGAPQEANRINRFLRAAGLATLKVSCRKPEDHDVASQGGSPGLTETETETETAAEATATATGKGQLFTVSLQPPVAMRAIPPGLGKHRRSLAVSTAASDRVRQRLARMAVADVTSHDVQALMDAYRVEMREAATLHLERALIRRLFNYSRDCWNWTAPAKNPGTGLKMPTVDNGRDRVMSMEEQARLDEAVQGCRNALVGPTLTLLRESAMRSSEPLKHARWRDVKWSANILSLTDAKAGKRDVPLSPVAIEALKQLRDLGRGEENDPIVHISYEALKASWELVCKRAEVKGLRLQDLRHTAATRMALKTGNFALVKALTGHKTPSQVNRYVNVKAADVVAVMHAQSPAVETAAPTEFVEKAAEVRMPKPAAAPSPERPMSSSLSMKADGGLGYPQEWALE